MLVLVSKLRDGIDPPVVQAYGDEVETAVKTQVPPP